MDLRSGTPFWLLRNGLLATYPPLDADERCDVAVIGAGITGALVAWHLAREGVDVVVLDRREAALGSTVASTALLLYATDTELHALARTAGEVDAARTYRLGIEAVDGIEALLPSLGDGCGFMRRESLYLASRKSHVRRLRRELDVRCRHGFDVELLDRGDLERIGGPAAPAALLCRGDAEIDPYRLTHRLLEAARSMGSRIYDRTEVTEVRVEGDVATLATDRGPSVRCRHVIHATGYEARELLGRDIGRLHSTFAIVSEPFAQLEGWPDHRLVWESARPYTYLRTTQDGRIIVGGEDARFSNAEARDRMIPRRSRKLADRFRTLFPALGFEIAWAWAGTFGTTDDGLPYIGEIPDLPGQYAALGYGGNGITFGMIAARILTDLCLGRENPDAAIFRFGRTGR